MTATRLNKVLIVLLLLLGFLLRIIPVLTDTVHFSFDQGLDIIMVKNLVSDHNLSLISRYSGLQGVLMGPLWTWFLAIGYVISNGNPASGVVMQSLLSVVGALLTYILFRKIIGEAGAWITFLFALFAPAFVGTSKVVLSPHPLIYIFVFYIWLCYKVFFEKKTKWIPVLGLLAGIFFQLEIAFAVFTPLSLVVLLIVFRSKKLLNLKLLLLGIAVFALTFVPQAIFDIRHEFLISKSLIGFITGENNSLYSSYSPITQRIFERINTFLEDAEGSAFFIKPAILSIVALALTIYGWLLILKDKSKERLALFKVLLSILLAFFIGFILYKGPLWPWYRAGLPIVYVFLLTIPLGFLWSQKIIYKFVISAVLLIFFWQGVGPVDIYRNITESYESPVILRTQKVLDYIYKDAGGKKFSYFAYTPPVYDYIWQYQFWWYGNTKYNKLPENLEIGVPLLGIGVQSPPPAGDEKLIYLIIEPNPQRPWEPNGWLENHIKVGKVVETKQFPGGLKVQKRTTNDQ